MQNREENGSGKMVDVGIVFQKMLMLLVMMSIGFLAGKTRVVSVESNHMLSLLINKITMPVSGGLFLGLQCAFNEQPGAFDSARHLFRELCADDCCGKAVPASDFSGARARGHL